MTKGFADIAIVDLDLTKTTWSRVHSSMRTLYLRLTREPESGWVRFFHEERESRIVLKRHGLWIEDGYIVFDCLLDDVEEHHIPDFQQSIDYANAKYRAYLAERREQGEQLRDDARVEEEELAALRTRIRGATPATAPPEPAHVTRAAADSPAAAARTPLVTTTISWTPATPVAAASAALPAWVAASKAAREKLTSAPASPVLEIPAAGLVAAAPPDSTQRATAAERVPQAPADAAIAPQPPEQTPPAPAVALAAAQSTPVASGTTGPSVTEPSPAPESAPEGGVADIADFNAKREEWRARFRAALASRPKEPARGND